MIIPSIDILNGRAVKLVKGDPNNKKFETNALELAQSFSIFPEINLIDLDAALGTGNNIELIRKISKICTCNVGGGIRTTKIAYDLLKAGANKIIIGTKADVEFLKQLPKEKIIIAIDSRKGKIVDKGWTNEIDETTIDRANRLKNYCNSFLYTYVDKEGTLEDIDENTVNELKKITKNKIQYAGGISSKDQIIKLESLGVDAVVGMAYYENKIDIYETFVDLLNFKKSMGLIPTIVKNTNGQILMLAYSNRESVIKSIKERKGIYFSRSRQELWEKGLTSGNTQELKNIKVDCDRDTLIYKVLQKNVACHTGAYTCFEDEDFNMESLYEIIESKISESNSFTDKVYNDETMLKEKIIEEADEVVNFKNKDNLTWEIADLLYFISILMKKNGIDYKDINNELKIRNLMKETINNTKL